MGIEEDAIKWVKACYSKNDSNKHEKEFGCIFWEEPGSQFSPDSMVWSQDTHGVRLYPPDKRLEILKSAFTSGGKKFLGDFHAHPVTRTWAGQLPSPDDLFLTTVAAEHWELNPPVQGIDSVTLAPRVQITLLLKFGELLVAEPRPGRTSYLDLQNQKVDLARLRQDYEKWHQKADERLGALPKEITHSQYLETLRAELSDINKIIDGRCTLRLVSALGADLDEKQLIAVRNMKDEGADLDAVFAIERENFGENVWKSRDSFRSRIGKDLAFVACKGPEVVGYLLLSFKNKAYLLEKMASKYKRQGIGRELVNFAKSHVQKMGAKEIRLHVRSENEPAPALDLPPEIIPLAMRV